MTDGIDHRFDPDRLRLDIGEVRAVEPEKLKKRRQQFVMYPIPWHERMLGASGKTQDVARFVLHLHWKHKGQPFKLANGKLGMDKVSPQSKRRALRDMERRGLISVDWRKKKSPIVLRVYMTKFGHVT